MSRTAALTVLFVACITFVVVYGPRKEPEPCHIKGGVEWLFMGCK